MPAKTTLPTQDRLLTHLAMVDDSTHCRDNLFPALVEELYMDGAIVTGDQVGAALLKAISHYLDRLTSQTKSLRRQLMRRNLERYLWAISYEFVGDDGQRVLDDAVRYCERNWSKVVG